MQSKNQPESEEKMLNAVQKNKIIDLKRQGKSNRCIAKLLGIDRTTVSKYWNETQRKLNELSQKNADSRTVNEEIYGQPTYKNRNVKKRKVTDELISRLKEILDADERKNRILDWEKRDKQRLTNIQIYEQIREEGYEISLSTINIELAEIRGERRQKNVYIRQKYEYGQRLEFDYGEVKLDLGEGIKAHSLAVFCAPASNFRWAFLYENGKQDGFFDAHVKFFELIGGVWNEIFYDNMRNVVSEFGKKEKKLNDELLKLASYYGFEVRTTNAYSGNEKGSVERSVEVLRNRIFAANMRFDSIGNCRKYMDAQLRKMSAGSDIEIEKSVYAR